MTNAKEIIWIAYATVFKPFNLCHEKTNWFLNDQDLLRFYESSTTAPQCTTAGNFMSNPVSSWFHPPLAPPVGGLHE
tara:strand:+ start:1730 stop:1960 length:231 start_codon:yes stop_codon:yes gene_type:complete